MQDFGIMKQKFFRYIYIDKNYCEHIGDELYCDHYQTEKDAMKGHKKACKYAINNL